MSVLARNTAFARIWTVQDEPMLPADLAEDLTDRGFVPGIGKNAPDAPLLSEAGLAEARLIPGGEALRFVSLSSSRGEGCLLRVREAGESDPVPPDGRAAVRHPRLVYLLEAGGPSNSDRNLCENLAEALLVRTGGLVEIAGRGVRGNKPSLYHSRWLGKIKA